MPRAETQILSHLCFSEFGVVIDAIRDLGAYDIHSPRVPSLAKVTEFMETSLASIPARQLWVNPDCGLKTRSYAETVESLHNVLAATGAVRKRLGLTA